MRGLNKVVLIGNLGKDPHHQLVEGDVSLVRFPLATSDVYKDRNGRSVSQTEWHNIVTWRGLAELAHKNLRKGSLIFLEGRIQYRQFDDKSGKRFYVTEIIAENIVMLDKKNQAENEYTQALPSGTVNDNPNTVQAGPLPVKDETNSTKQPDNMSDHNTSHFHDADELL